MTRWNQAAQELGQGGLSGAVGADDRHDLAAPQLEAHAGEGIVPAPGYRYDNSLTASTRGGAGGSRRSAVADLRQRGPEPFEVLEEGHALMDAAEGGSGRLQPAAELLESDDGDSRVPEPIQPSPARISAMERVAMSTAVVTNEPIVVSFNRLLTSCCKRTSRVVP